MTEEKKPEKEFDREKVASIGHLKAKDGVAIRMAQVIEKWMSWSPAGVALFLKSLQIQKESLSNPKGMSHGGSLRLGALIPPKLNAVLSHPRVFGRNWKEDPIVWGEFSKQMRALVIGVMDTSKNSNKAPVFSDEQQAEADVWEKAISDEVAKMNKEKAPKASLPPRLRPTNGSRIVGPMPTAASDE